MEFQGQFLHHNSSNNNWNGQKDQFGGPQSVTQLIYYYEDRFSLKGFIAKLVNFISFLI